MQPKPMAETSRPLFPSLRVCTLLLLRSRVGGPLPAVLLVADRLHPGDRRAVQLLLDGDLAHGRGRRGAVPVLLARREPDHVTRADLPDRPALALGPAASGGDDQGLAERMGVPGGAGAGGRKSGG